MVPDPIVSAWSHIFAPDRSIMFPECSELLQIHREDVAGCARYADQPEINTGGIREEDIGAFRVKKSSVMKAN